MARPDKVAVVDEVRDQFTGSVATLLTDYRGLSVAELAVLRAELRKAGATYKVAKNTLTRRAAADAGMDGLDQLLVGPTALVFCGEDPVAPAKALKRFKGEHPALEIKGAYLDGEVLDAAATLGLAELASREELLAQLAGLMQGALAGFARLLNALPEQQARLVQALIDAGGVEARGFTPTAAVQAVAESAEAAAEDTVDTVDTAADAAETAVDTAADAAETVVETAADVTEAAIDTAADATETVLDAAASAVGTAAEAATDVVESAAEAVTGDGDEADTEAQPAEGGKDEQA